MQDQVEIGERSCLAAMTPLAVRGRQGVFDIQMGRQDLEDRGVCDGVAAVLIFKEFLTSDAQGESSGVLKVSVSAGDIDEFCRLSDGSPKEAGHWRSPRQKCTLIWPDLGA